MSTCRIGIIGYGAFGKFLKSAWESVDSVRVNMIMRTSMERARSSAVADGIPFYTDSYHELIASPEVDLVVIATPPYLHAEQAIATARAGKCAMIEKPLALTPMEADDIIAVFNETGSHAAVDYVMRYAPLMEMLKEVVDRRIFGRLQRILYENYASDTGIPPDHWFWDPAKSGGILIEHGVHFFDLANWMANSSVKRITAHSVSRTPGTEDRMLATVEYENGILATFYHAFSRHSSLELTTARYVFDLGEIEVAGWIPLAARATGVVSEKGLEDLSRIFQGGRFVIGDPSENQVRSGGHLYQVSRSVDIEYEYSADKNGTYALCARRALGDLLRSISDPTCRMRVTLEDAAKSLEIAFQATQFARTGRLAIAVG